MKKKFLDLGKQPITNSYLNKKKVKREFFYNLSVGFNEKNYLVSIMNFVNPKKQYTNKYAHRASQSKTMNKSFAKIASRLKKRFKPKRTLEIGSNDGVFIKNFKRDKVIAVEPCGNLAKITRQNNFKTYNDFWSKKLAKKIIKNNKKVDLIYSANTISHIPNLNEVFSAVSLALSKNGIFVFEDPYIGSVVKINSYDQFYDEHVHLFSLLSMSKILSKTDLNVFDVEIINTHGGSIRFYVCKKNSRFKKTKNLKKVKSIEVKQKLHKIDTYRKFSSRVKKSKKDLRSLLSKLKARNKKIISYGATYKSTTVFNYCDIGEKFIDYVIDTTPNKQGKFTPGKHLPIISPEKGLDNNVDYAFLGAWNFEKEIKQKEKSFLRRGGKFIVHVPKVRII
tara:strand:+ start:166 stop:1344 length:1179 start_codon:yes stop_codon:yes gene_type:complete